MQLVPIEERIVQQAHKINLTKDEIFSKCLEWMAQTFSIEIKDKENGKIIGKGITSFSGGPAIFPCQFSMKVEIKDNRYRATYNNFVGMFGTSRKGPKPLEYKMYIDQVKSKLMTLDNNLYNFLTISKKADDW